MHTLSLKLLTTLCHKSNSVYLITRTHRSLCTLNYIRKGPLCNSNRKASTVIWNWNANAGVTRYIMSDAANKDNSFRLALIQLSVGDNKNENLQNASKLIEEAVQKGAKIVCLPECFNSPYGIQYFEKYAEPIPNGQTCDIISSLAKQLNVYIIAGSIPEVGEDSKLYNTCTVYDPTGNLIGQHRKVHLFDIDIPGKISFQESKVLTPGDNLTIVKTEFCKIGIGICYDLRFPEMAQIYCAEGCEMLVYPGAFNMTTGPAHWELLQRSRALDNQLYVATISPARDLTASYNAWGHSMVVDPWGKILVEAQETQTIIYADIDFAHLQEVRKNIPVTLQKRNDIYKTLASVSLK